MVAGGGGQHHQHHHHHGGEEAIVALAARQAERDEALAGSKRRVAQLEAELLDLEKELRLRTEMEVGLRVVDVVRYCLPAAAAQACYGAAYWQVGVVPAVRMCRCCLPATRVPPGHRPCCLPSAAHVPRHEARHHRPHDHCS